MSDELNQQTGDVVSADAAKAQGVGADLVAAAAEVQVAPEVGAATEVQVAPEVGAATEATPPADEARPWHGSDNPLEALFQWAQAEFAKLRPAA